MFRSHYVGFGVVFLLMLVNGPAPLHAPRFPLQQNKELVKRFGEAVNAKDYGAVRELVTPDFVRHSQATPEVEVKNREQFIQYLRADSAVFPDSHMTIEHMVAERDLVAVWMRYEATQEGQMGPFPPSHKRIQIDIAGVLRVRDGKLAEAWMIWDNITALTQLGYFPPPKQ